MKKNPVKANTVIKDIKVKKKSPSKTIDIEAAAAVYGMNIFQLIAALNNPVLWEIIGGEVVGGGEAGRGPVAAIHEYLLGYAAKVKKKSK